MKIEELISKARGRTILIGEHHTDRATIRRTNELLIRADKAGYSTFGAEISQEGRSPYWGLREELKFLKQRPKNAVLSEHDNHSDLDADTTGKNPRPNRHWQLQQALALNWKIIAIDPFHWNWIWNTEEGYISSREPAMAELIERYSPMIAVCGYGHVAGLSHLLGNKCVYALSSKANLKDAGEQKFWIERITFAQRLPIIET